MKFYIAGRWQNQERYKFERQFLIDRGHQVTSRWLDAERDPDPTPEFFEKHGAKRASQDLEDVDAADALILDMAGGMGRRAGMMVEFGYALAKDKKIILIGERPCVFTQLADAAYSSWAAFHDGVRNLMLPIQPLTSFKAIAWGEETEDASTRTRANDRQVGGDHYRKLGEFQVWDAWRAWDLDPFQAVILKYVVRYRDKGGVEDLRKATHYLEKLIELEEQK